MIGSYTNIGSNITICCIMTLNLHMKLTTHCNFTIQEKSKLGHFVAFVAFAFAPKFWEGGRDLQMVFCQ